ncbi:low molecular weight protein arginine phosphatase [Bacillus sp. FJAT-50079]|uniref:low molecular weight protein arginine phosphatase n=1 Tax=Bacillus sp. FJAT-50079 TaxID=2833577 RepID=UPI001BC9EC9E|nr:low molecular weight protein arginine phosphatase [Bacillus sp. FJAT-50079]MBS4206802.1 low molecular weight protein arginine phosphatase [Bacillus sp. FJAT-50079]
MNILFICTGNTCRSPMAEAIYNHLTSDSAQAKSAGVFAMEGADAASHSIAVLEENGIVINHTSKNVNETDLTWADLILTMTNAHKDMLIGQFPIAAHKVFTLKEYANHTNDGDVDVFDPYGGDINVYRETFHELYQLIKRIAEEKVG